MKTLRLFALVPALALIAACGAGEPAEPVTTTVTETVTETMTVEPTIEPSAEAEAEEPAAEVVADPGTRDNPLKIGETRKLSPESAWTVGLTASVPDAEGVERSADAPADTRVILGTVTVDVDGAALAAQGLDLANQGADPYLSLYIEFVGADGCGYAADSGCYPSNPLYSQPTVYADATVSGDVCALTPSDAIDGGLWRIANSRGETVWIASS